MSRKSLQTEKIIWRINFRLQIQFSNRPELFLNTDTDLGFAGFFIADSDCGIHSAMISVAVILR